MTTAINNINTNNNRVSRTYTISQAITTVESTNAMSHLAWRGMWPENSEYCIMLRMRSSCRWCFWAAPDSIPCCARRYSQQISRRPFEVMRDYRQHWDIDDGAAQLCHCASSPKCVPIMLASIGMISLLLAPIAICIGTTLEASGSLPSSLWWLFFAPLWFACCCCISAPCVAAVNEDGCEQFAMHHLVSFIISIVVGCPCLFSLLAGISLSLGSANAMPAYAVLMPIFVWTGLLLALMLLVWCFGICVLPLVLCIKNDCKCDPDYMCVLMGGGDGKFFWSMLNIAPPFLACCVVGPVAVTAVLACLKFTDGYSESIPVWSIGLPILLALFIISLPLCFLAICIYKEEVSEMEGHRETTSSSHLYGRCAPDCCQTKRNGAIHNFEVYQYPHSMGHTIA